MRAVVYDRYGPPEVLRLKEVERPVPQDEEVLVRVHATTVTRTDCGLRSAEFFISRFYTGIRRPKQRVPGIEFAGVVDAAGAADRVPGGGRGLRRPFRRTCRVRLRP